MGGLVLLLGLTVVMALASFLAGILPLSMPLSQSQLRLMSSVGVGILVGTSMVVIIPEGIGAIATVPEAAHAHSRRSIQYSRDGVEVRWAAGGEGAPSLLSKRIDAIDALGGSLGPVVPRNEEVFGADASLKLAAVDPPTQTTPEQVAGQGPKHTEEAVPTFWVGLALIAGFILMFLIDRLPRHASENFQAPAAPRHISLSNLGATSLSGEEEERAGFLGSLTPTPKQSRSLATTTGLVIHAAADGIAMGASAASSNTKLGLIIFLAIMVHKAPAAFGLTTLLLKQGLSKRAARGHLIVFSLASPLGAWATFILVNLLGAGGDGTESPHEGNHWWTGMLLLFSAGTFLYVAMHAMQENETTQTEGSTGANGFAEGSNSSSRKQTRPQMRDTIATVAGMLLPLLTQFGHHH